MYDFNPAIQAQACLKERVVWLAFMGILFFLLYGAANEFASLTSPHLSLFFKWEENIPFVPAFIIPYMSSDLVFVVAFLLVQTRFQLRVLAMRVVFIVVLSVSIFVVFPLQFSFDKPQIESFHILFNILEADKPFNQLPSLHVSFSIVFWFCMKQHISNFLIKAALACWLLLIIISTLFVFQHHFIDLPTGLIVGFLAVYLFNDKSNIKILSYFMTPRHLKMGLYFLLGSILLMVMSFKISPLFIYLFLSTLSVSLTYAFGLNNLLVSSHKKPNIFQWLIFSPYYLGSKISWHFYQRSIPLLAKVDEKVFIGRFPTFNEYSQISGLNIEHIINLSAELQFNKTQLIQHRFNFLDQTIQNPRELHRVVQAIEMYKTSGVYIHCALGLSRSILVIWAWMIFNGKTDQEIERHIAKIRPRYVQSKYMQINIALYREFIAQSSSKDINFKRC